MTIKIHINYYNHYYLDKIHILDESKSATLQSTSDDDDANSRARPADKHSDSHDSEHTVASKTAATETPDAIWNTDNAGVNFLHLAEN